MQYYDTTSVSYSSCKNCKELKCLHDGLCKICNVLTEIADEIDDLKKDISEMKDDMNEIKKTLNELIVHVQYMPQGAGYMEAQTHFEESKKPKTAEN